MISMNSWNGLSRLARPVATAVNQLATEASQDQARNDEIGSLTSQLATSRASLRQKYGDAAKAAGSYSDTAEFQKGLDDEVERGYKGYEAAINPRIQALNTELGHTGPNGTSATFGVLGGQNYLPPAPGSATAESESAPASAAQTSSETVEGAAPGATNAVNTLRAKTRFGMR